jgi:3-oxoacyl-[acyl-carrier protein] reductase
VIDLHTHLLPNIDDGSSSVEQSVGVLRRMGELGITAVALTPHVTAMELVDGAEGAIERRERALRGMEPVAPSPPELLLGFEVMLDQPMPAVALGDRRLSLAGSRYYLVEFRLSVVAEFATTVLGQIARSGVVPVVAHPERYDECSAPVVQAWREVGATIQVDATTLTRAGVRGKRARELVEQGLADFLASDNHGGRRTVATGRKYLEELGHPAVARLLTEDNPRAIVEDQPLAPVPPVELKGGVMERIRRITGGSRGIGAATVNLLAQAGADVAFTYHTRREDADRVVEGVEALGRRAKAVQADLAEREACERAVRETTENLGRLDFFIANAGIWPVEEVGVAQMPDERWRRTLAVNLDSVFYGTRAALEVMQPGGRVIIVSSTAGQRGEAFHADYAATKGAIISFVKSVCVEAPPRGITVNSVAPGWVDTEMSQIPYEEDGGKGKQRIESTIPVGRVATPEEIAGPIVFLCSELAASINGEILNVNGGSVLCG